MAKTQQGDSRLTLGAAGSGKTAPGLAWLLFKGYRKVLEGLGERKQEQEHRQKIRLAGAGRRAEEGQQRLMGLVKWEGKEKEGVTGHVWKLWLTKRFAWSERVMEDSMM